MKLYTGPISMFGRKVEIALAEKGIAHEIEYVPFSLGAFYADKHPEVLRINPKKQVPVLVDGDLELFDSTQICEYLEERAPTPALWPADPKARARARLLELKVDEVLFPSVLPLLTRARNPISDDEVQTCRATIAAFCEEMNTLLAGRSYLAEVFSYADITLFMALLFFGFAGVQPRPDQSAHLKAWRERVGARPAVQGVVHACYTYLREQGVAPAA